MAKISKLARELFAGRTTGRNDYYGSKGVAVSAFDNALAEFDLCFSRTELVDYNGDEGRALLTICDELTNPVGYAQLSWYRMPSGNYEFTGYIT